MCPKLKSQSLKSCNECQDSSNKMTNISGQGTDHSLRGAAVDRAAKGWQSKSSSQQVKLQTRWVALTARGGTAKDGEYKEEEECREWQTKRTEAREMFPD